MGERARSCSRSARVCWCLTATRPPPPVDRVAPAVFPIRRATRGSALSPAARSDGGGAVGGANRADGQLPASGRSSRCRTTSTRRRCRRRWPAPLGRAAWVARRRRRRARASCLEQLVDRGVIAHRRKRRRRLGVGVVGFRRVGRERVETVGGVGEEAASI